MLVKLRGAAAPLGQVFSGAAGSSANIQASTERFELAYERRVEQSALRTTADVHGSRVSHPPRGVERQVGAPMLVTPLA